MTKPWSVLCPIDFSPASRGALRHALAIAHRFQAHLTLLTVDDELLVEVADGRMGAGWSQANNERELQQFLAEAGGAPASFLTFDVRVGKPALTILAAARDRPCDLIVMSTHGRSGMSKLFFGATAERVLRETPVHVLLTPPEDPGPATFDELVAKASPVLMPVDFGSAMPTQIRMAAAIVEVLPLRLLVGHVVEPIELPVAAQVDVNELLAERHLRASAGLEGLSLALLVPRPETLIAFGDPVDEIARWIREKRVGLLVMGLHGGDGGPRMGSVTYRTICKTHVLTLALAPT